MAITSQFQTTVESGVNHAMMYCNATVTTAETVTIPHGLGFVPTTVLLTPAAVVAGPGAQCRPFVMVTDVANVMAAAADATNVYVRISAPLAGPETVYYGLWIGRTHSVSD